jgi:elongator complex protein 1
MSKTKTTLNFRKSFAAAFDLMMKQRINLNLLYDHNPRAFLEHWSQFVEQVSCVDVANLNLFLGELQYLPLFKFYLMKNQINFIFPLRNKDFTTTMYQNHCEEKSVPKDEEKVDRICNKLREVLQTFYTY